MNDKFCLQSCGVLPLYLMKEIHSNIWPNLKIGISSCMENSTLNFALPRGKDVITLVEDNPLFNSASSQNLPVLFSYIKLCCPILANKSTWKTWTLKKKEEHLTIIYNCIYDRVSIRFVVCQTFSTISVFAQDEVYNSERIWEKLCNLVAKKC